MLEKNMVEEEKSEKEKRIRAITNLYYSNPKVQQVLLDFAKNRETVPRYFEGFGKRPDMLQYPSDIINLVKKGATSFHCSEEIWNDPLGISNDLNQKQVNDLRKGWDLLIDIDSPYLDLSKIAARLVVRALEFHGVNNYGIKFSVAGDTPVLIKCDEKIELLPIEKAINLFKSGKKIEVFSLNKSKKNVFSKVYDSLEHYDDLFEIKYEQSKIPVKATAHHSVFVFDKGKIYEKKTSELKVGNFLVTYNSCKNPTFNSKKNRNNITNKFILGKNQHMSNSLEKEIKLDADLMRLIGYYLAEGHITNTINQVGFSFNVKEKDYIEDCVELLEKITKKKSSIRHPNSGSTQILIHSKEWSSFFESVCGKSKGKHLPWFVWDASKEMFLELLKGYLRGDGYKIGKYTVAAKSVALQLAKELVWLCKLNGISCTLSSEQNKPHKLPQGNFFKGGFVYILKINKSEICMPEFDRERNKFSPYPRDRTFPISGLKEIYHKIKPKFFNKHRAEQMTLKKERANLNRIKKVIDWFKEFKSEKFDEKSLEIIKDYESLFSSDVGVVKVKSIKKIGKGKVYDISVKDSEAFFGGDYPILLHNSGSKGFHVMVGWGAFPDEFEGKITKEMFPEFPRAITEYLFDWIKPIFMKEAGKIMSLGKKEDSEVHCISCDRVASKGVVTKFICPICNLEAEKKEKASKRRLKCLNSSCAGVLEVIDEKEFYFCDLCKDIENQKLQLNSLRSPDSFMEKRGEKVSEHAKFDLVLVAPRHLFRMPYSLHEKTSLSSIVISKEQIDNFVPKDANPFNLKILEFNPSNEKGEATKLLKAALEWKKAQVERQEKVDEIHYKNYKQENKDYQEIQISPGDIKDSFFPDPIKKILNGLVDGKKRGLFILLTFFKSLNYSPEEINKRIKEWNSKNPSPLKEGYIKSQIEWHLKQKRKILPPNYDNEAFYKDLGVLDKKPDVKNPLVEVIRNLRKSRKS
jgi:hypothetical protein